MFINAHVWPVFFTISTPMAFSLVIVSSVPFFIVYQSWLRCMECTLWNVKWLHINLFETYLHLQYATHSVCLLIIRAFKPIQWVNQQCSFLFSVYANAYACGGVRGRKQCKTLTKYTNFKHWISASRMQWNELIWLHVNVKQLFKWIAFRLCCCHCAFCKWNVILCNYFINSTII